MTFAIDIPKQVIAKFCQQHGIRKLSVFGSVLRDDFCDRSDIDFLVEFHRDRIPGLIKLAGMELELSAIVGCKANLRTPEDLSPYFRQEVINIAVPHYVEQIEQYVKN